MKFETVSVIGLGYIGLPTAAMFASCGVNVVGVDKQKHVVDVINQGEIHIVEPELLKLVKQAVNTEKLKATLHVQQADAFVIAVPTPFKDSNDGSREPDLSYIKAACHEIAPMLNKGNLVVLESTSPVGTTDKICKWMAQLRPDLTFPVATDQIADVFVAYCPERVLPGKIIQELVSNERIIGGITPACAEMAVNLYKTFVRSACHVTDARTAEMAKLTENASRDVQIAFANELSIICDEQNINVWKLIELANKHPRVDILQPGPGVGGHCIAVDPWFIIHKSPETARLIKEARLINDSKPEWVVTKIKAEIHEYLENYPKKSMSQISIAVYGLSFKPDIDDLRESPALEICRKIATRFSVKVIAIEPNITTLPDDELFVLDNEELDRQTADIGVFLVPHKQFLNRKYNYNYTISPVNMTKI